LLAKLPNCPKWWPVGDLVTPQGGGTEVLPAWWMHPAIPLIAQTAAPCLPAEAE